MRKAHEAGVNRSAAQTPYMQQNPRVPLLVIPPKEARKISSPTIKNRLGRATRQRFYVPVQQEIKAGYFRHLGKEQKLQRSGNKPTQSSNHRQGEPLRQHRCRKGTPCPKHIKEGDGQEYSGPFLKQHWATIISSVDAFW